MDGARGMCEAVLHTIAAMMLRVHFAANGQAMSRCSICSSRTELRMAGGRVSKQMPQPAHPCSCATHHRGAAIPCKRPAGVQSRAQSAAGAHGWNAAHEPD